MLLSDASSMLFTYMPTQSPMLSLRMRRAAATKPDIDMALNIAGSQARGIIKDSHKIERRAYRYAVCSHVVILSSSLVLLSATISPPATSSSSSACCCGSSLSSACTERGGRGCDCSCVRGGLSARSRRPGSCGRRPSVCCFWSRLCEL